MKNNSLFLVNGSFESLLGRFRDKVKMVFGSPPYNLSSRGPVKKVGGRKKGKYDSRSYSNPETHSEYSQFDSEEIYNQWMVDCVGTFSELICQDGVIILNHKDRRKNGVILSPHDWITPAKSKYGLDLIGKVVWDRKSSVNNGIHTLTNIHETIYVLGKSGVKKRYFNKVHICQDGVYKGVPDVIRINPDTKNNHPAPFPTDLPAIFMALYTRPGDLVCDPFSGSGTTALAAAVMRRSFVGSEICYKYWIQSRMRLVDELGSHNIKINKSSNEYLDLTLTGIPKRTRDKILVGKNGKPLFRERVKVGKTKRK